MLTHRLTTTPFSLLDDFFWKERDVDQHTGLSYSRNEEGINVRLMVPGYGKEDLELSIEGNILIISSKEKEPLVFQRLKIPANINIDKATAKCEKGVLTVTAPLLKPPDKEKKILSIK